MELNKNQIELLEGIQSKMRHGDITAIAKKTGLTKEYVGKVLNPKSDRFNGVVVTEAVCIINQREEHDRKLLQSISATANTNIAQ